MSDGNGGFILLYRSILDHPAFRTGEEAMFFAYLVLNANWKSGERRYEDRLYRLQRGDLVIGMRKLAEEFGWSHKRVRSAIKGHSDRGMLTLSWAQHGTHRAPIITICNYDKFQLDPGKGAQGGARPGAQGGHSGGTPKKEGNKEEKYTVDHEFDEFWRVYPSRHPHANPKKPARAKFDAALSRGVTAAEIIRGAEAYAAYVTSERVDAKFVAQAVTWLSQARWEEYTAPRPEETQARRPLLL